jgi:hypothetical protein
MRDALTRLLPVFHFRLGVRLCLRRFRQFLVSASIRSVYPHWSTTTQSRGLKHNQR